MTGLPTLGSRVMAVAFSGALVLLPIGPAQAADWDVNRLPGFASDTKVLTSSIISWPLEGSVEEVETTTHGSGETVVTLDADILFMFTKAALPAAAQARIASAVAKAPKGSAVSIGGHTDDVGTDSANLTLSQARAKAVAAVVKAARPDLALTVKGFGESTPAASNDDTAGRSKNRRVEIRFPD
jgi:OOP family OmpA-OmpF porin